MTQLYEAKIIINLSYENSISESTSVKVCEKSEPQMIRISYGKYICMICKTGLCYIISYFSLAVNFNWI